MKRSDIYLASIWITFFPRMILPILLLALIGGLASMCDGHPPCPVDPLSHVMVCDAIRDPWALQRAVEAESVYKTQAQWQAEADSQAEFTKSWDAAERQQSIKDDHERTIKAVAQLRRDGYYMAARKMLAAMREEEQRGGDSY